MIIFYDYMIKIKLIMNINVWELVKININDVVVFYVSYN